MWEQMIISIRPFSIFYNFMMEMRGQEKIMVPSSSFLYSPQQKKYIRRIWHASPDLPFPSFPSNRGAICEAMDGSILLCCYHSLFSTSPATAEAAHPQMIFHRNKHAFVMSLSSLLVTRNDLVGERVIQRYCHSSMTLSHYEDLAHFSQYASTHNSLLRIAIGDQRATM